MVTYPLTLKDGHLVLSCAGQDWLRLLWFDDTAPAVPRPSGDVGLMCEHVNLGPIRAISQVAFVEAVVRNMDPGCGSFTSTVDFCLTI